MTRHGVEPMEASAEEIQRAFSPPGSQGGLPAQRQSGMVAPMQDAAALPDLAPPRDEGRVLAKIKQLAAAAGDDWYYRFPVKRNVKDENGNWTKVTDYIEGPSIKCANNVARIYGNDIVDCRLGSETEDAWVFYARFVDRETGYVLVRAFQQRKQQASLKTDSARALDIVFQIGQSKSIRNVICNALETFTTFAFDEAKRSIVARIGSKMEEARTWIKEQVARLKVPIERVEFAHGRKAAEWLAPDMALIYAEINAINDGMASADETWPPREPGVEQDKQAKTDETVSKENQELENAGRQQASGQQDRGPQTSPAGGDRPAQTGVNAEPGSASAATGDKPKPRGRGKKAQADAPAEGQQDAQPASPPPPPPPPPVETKAAKTAEPEPPKDDQPRLMPYQSPPRFWCTEFIKLLRRMDDFEKIEQLVTMNTKTLQFVQRASEDGYREVTDAIAQHKQDIKEAAQ